MLLKSSSGQIRVSTGTAAVLGLQKTKLNAEPTTAYLMTYFSGKCSANCAFCPQAQLSRSNVALLSRVSWPSFSERTVLEGLTSSFRAKKIKRVCIQALNYPKVSIDIQKITQSIKDNCSIPVSVSCQPKSKHEIEYLKKCGVDILSIAVDAATEELFEKIKGRERGLEYSWKKIFSRLKEAVDVFGDGNVVTHLIVGLGESERDAVEMIQSCRDMGVLPALFAFTPIIGTTLEKKLPPKLESYRRIQLARYLIVKSNLKAEDFRFNVKGEITSFGLLTKPLEKIIETGNPFRTSGCPDCNRPYYNEKPSGPIYNYPYKISKEEMEKIKKQL